MRPRTAIIVQARRASTRLPDKVLLDLRGRTVLNHVLRRCGAVPDVAHVVCAIPDTPGHDALAAEASAAGATVVAGPEADVLGRYLLAARHVGADTVLRVTSDCPLIDPSVCRAVMDLRERTGADYAANNMPPSWPHGLDCEAFTVAALELAYRHAAEPSAREHVTPWIRANRELRRENLGGPGGEAAKERWTLDYPEDLLFLRALAEAAGGDLANLGWQDILAVLDAHPDLRQINAERVDQGRLTAVQA